jgi:lipopolysaccharide export system protein LptA
MKKIFFLLALGFCGAASAQLPAALLSVPATNAVADTNAPAKPRAPTVITSDAADFDMNIHQGIYRGHVFVQDPDVKLTCAWLVIDLPESGSHLNHVLADTNVVVDFTDEKGQTYHVTAARAVYDYKVVDTVTNETVTFSGKPKVVTDQSTIESEPMIWDRARNKFSFYAPIMTSTAGLNGDGDTNAPMLNFLK